MKIIIDEAAERLLFSNEKSYAFGAICSCVSPLSAKNLAQAKLTKKGVHLTFMSLQTLSIRINEIFFKWMAPDTASPLQSNQIHCKMKISFWSSLSQ